jgi:TorA maturation chaperone TorD
MDRKQFIKTEELRSSAFNLFSLLLLEPEEELLREPSVFLNLGTYLNELHPGIGNELIKLPGMLEGYTLQQLQVEYARLFIGPFKVPVPPYSSIHFGENILMGETTLWVEKFYNYAGLEFDPELKDLPDHVAIETEFLYYLIFNQLHAYDQGFYDDARALWDKQKIFFEKHYKI